MIKILIFCCIGYFFLTNGVVNAENVALNGTAVASDSYYSYLPDNVKTDHYMMEQPTIACGFQIQPPHPGYILTCRKKHILTI